MMPGKMDRNITIQKPTYAVSTTTNQREISSWATFKTVWAALVNKQSMEVVEEGQMVFKNVHEFKVRYNDVSGITSDMRISYGSDIYNIVGIKELGRGDGYLINSVRKDND